MRRARTKRDRDGNITAKMNDFTTIAIVGAGAVGGYYGGRLAQHGRQVHFLLRGDFDAWKSNGLRVQSIDGDFIIPPDRLNIHKIPAAMPEG